MKTTSIEKLRVLVTGGPTRAYLDDFRYLTNHSTGEVAFHLCSELLKKRVSTSLVVGPSSFPFAKLKLAKHCPVETYQEMRKQVLEVCQKWKPHFVIFSAAVLDFEPTKVKKGKTSSNGNWNLSLRPTPKIIEEVRQRFPHIQRIGFKLEPGKFSEAKAEKFAEAKGSDQELWALCLNYKADVGTKHHKALIWTAEKNCVVSNKRAIAREIVKTIL